MRKKLMEGKTIEAAAVATGMCERTARTWKQGKLPSQTKGERAWRTRQDPFAQVWERDVVPLLEADEKGVLEGLTVLEVLQERYPAQFDAGQVRTIQRRMREWRALRGPEKDVKFQQDEVPGRAGSFDFTHGEELEVTVVGELFKHLIFEFVLCFSGWTWVMLAYGETFEAMVAGIQGALWELGGVPQVLRHDNLSAATHELARSGGRALNRRFSEVLTHYGALRSSRIEPGESHQNGVAEKAHHLLKSQVAQALVIRGSRDFASAADYLAFLRRVVDKTRHRGIDAQLAQDKANLRALPSAPVPCYSSYDFTVRCWSTVCIGKRMYSVPSRLIGHEVQARVLSDTVEVYFRGKLVETMPRLRGNEVHHIDYRHVIWSLVRKPGAFARYRYREDLFPSLVFRRAYDALRDYHGERADVEYVRILHLAASTMQADVETALSMWLDQGERFDYAAVKNLASPQKSAVPVINVPEPSLAIYDALLTAVGGAA